jgi:tetratricopeptide (TPR) repeat protein
MISTSERNVRARAIAEAALTYPTEKRAAFLARTCNEDAELRALVLGHLRARNGLEEDAVPDPFTRASTVEPGVSATSAARPAPSRAKIIGGLVGAVVLVLLGLWFQTARERDDARESAVQAHASADRLSNLVERSVDRLEQTQPAAADSVLRSLLDLRLETLGHGHPSVRQVRRDLARIAARSGSFTRAESLRREQVSDAEDRYGPYHPEVADDLVDLGHLLLEERKLDGAIQAANRAVLIYARNEEGTERVGEAHLLAGQAHLEGDDIEPGEQSLHAAVGALRPHPDKSRPLADALEALGSLYAEQGRPSDADVVWTEALAVRRGDSSGSRADLARVLTRVAGARAGAGEPDEAAKLWEEAVSMYESAIGPDDVRTLDAKSHYGVLLARLGRSLEAEPYFRDVVRKRKNATSPILARSYTTLGYLYHEEDRLAWAESHLRLALDHQLEAAGLYEEETVSAMVALADVLRDLCRVDEAERLYDHALAVCDSIFDEPHPVRSAGLVGLGALLSETDRTTEAEPLLRQAHITSQAVLGTTHPETMAVGTTLAVCLTELGDELEAARILQENVTALTQCCGPDDPETIRARDALWTLLPRENGTTP